MAASFVRTSKYRHVFGETKKDQKVEGFRITNCAFEGSFIAANGKYVAFCVEVGGSGAFSVLTHAQKGRLAIDRPKVNAHNEYVLDLQWNPFDDKMLASCSEDGSIHIWNIPEDGLESLLETKDQKNLEQEDALLKLDYHTKRCVQIAWHPIAQNIMLSVSQDPQLCVWNLDDGEVIMEIPKTDSQESPKLEFIIWNAAWSSKGDKIVTSSKDGMLRIYDARSGVLLNEGQGHKSKKPQRVIFVMGDKYLLSTGFSKMAERQYAIWDANTMEELELVDLDTANGCLIPYYDPDSEMVYLAAKGDSVIRYYELTDKPPYIHYLLSYTPSSVQRGLSFIPKRDVSVNDHEVMRFYKLISSRDGIIEPVSFTVPRKAVDFQHDIYPNAVSGESAQTADDWFSGKDVEPNRIDMSTKFIGNVTKKKAASGGGLKKAGGLKGLKAKKAAATGGEKESQPITTTTTTTTTVEAVEVVEAVEPAKEERSSSESSSEPPSPSVVSGYSTLIENLQMEINAMKEKSKKQEDDVNNLEKRVTELEKLLTKKNEEGEIPEQ